METSDDLYTRILTNEPSARTFFLVLSKLKEEGHLQRVIEESLRALAIYPNDIPLRQLLAETYLEAGQVSEAEAEVDKVTSLIQDLIASYKLQAEIYRKQGRQEEAMDAIKLYLAHRPEDQEALDLSDALKPLEETPTPEFEPVTEETPAPEPEPITEEPSAPVEEIIETEPTAAAEKESVEIPTPSLAEIYFKQGQIKEAIETYEGFVSQNPEDESARDRLEELKTIMENARIEKEELGRAREKKEKMIAILESWLANIQDQFNTA
jgi:tetratricopeptide (TPR) repeat protein